MAKTNRQLLNDEESENESFSEFIKTKRENAKNPSGGTGISTKDLGEMLGVEYEYFRKIINGTKRTKNRDCIIAICAALGLDSETTNKALVLYDYMPTLDPMNNGRDDVLVNALDDYAGKTGSIENINKTLRDNKFSELDTVNHRPSAKSATKKNLPYKVLKRRIRSYSEDTYLGDPYESLSTVYSPYRYQIMTEMWVSDTNKTPQHLRATMHYGLTNSKNLENYYTEYSCNDGADYINYDSLDETGNYQFYFLDLKRMAENELEKLLNILNNTINYQERISANIYGDSLHIFAEAYNYNAPELEEYCLFEYIEGHQQLSIYQRSEFMHCYLDEEQYSTLYGNKVNNLIERYSSIEELEKLAEDDRKADSWLLNSRIRTFKNLETKANEMVKNLQCRKKFVNNLNYIYESRDRVCEYFHVENEFDCMTDNTGDIMITNTNCADFKIKDEETITITLDDLYRAFELGFKDIEQICRVKQKLGSIDAITHIDTITTA